ncbi:hypothetical protein OGAPHI_003244 [Ogataea philodendri]|uniref:GTPase-activating protein GYP5 n=1 Tax=Ogataea philodendri TaxID=1378263 RepID=A0A9P8P7S9_9ASCO|nr:uncharacterized protein OGAPHI_003244 [Ogataea philodendri]KAH3666795.1 hypothetical protein OGAPHI_003244 [Ogataea philodendri]
MARKKNRRQRQPQSAGKESAGSESDVVEADVDQQDSIEESTEHDKPQESGVQDTGDIGEETEKPITEDNAPVLNHVAEDEPESESHDEFIDATGVTVSSTEEPEEELEEPVGEKLEEPKESTPVPEKDTTPVGEDVSEISTAKSVSLDKTTASLKEEAQSSGLVAEAGSDEEKDEEKPEAVPVVKPVPPELPPREEEAVLITSDQIIPEEQNGAEYRDGEFGVNRSVKTLRKWFNFNTKDEAYSDDLKEVMSELEGPENQSLAYSRYWENVEDLKLQSAKDRELLSQGANGIRKTFNEIKTGIEITNDNELMKGIDWEFWSEVINDYSSVLEHKPEKLIENITKGIPRELRGMVWQVICNSKSLELEEFFRANRNCESDYQKLIKRDLARTSFVTNSAVRTKIDDLYEIIKVYSVYDTDVGYTQGMSFITVPLLMNMEASESFCMLVKLMNIYDFKQLFIPHMPGLHLKLYQFDRLLEDSLPDLYLHLKHQGVKSSMYATQWFLTLFGYKFPLEMVLRIYDIVIAEGIESVLKFAMNLMAKNKQHLLELKFDDLLPFLKDKLFFYYVDNSGDDHAGRTLKDAYSNREISVDTYKLEEFVSDSMNIKILPVTLRRYEAEFIEIHKLESEMEAEIAQLKTKNGQLLREIRNIEAAYATLNREHVEIANEMVQGKVEIAHLQDENRQLQNQIDDLTGRMERLESEKQTDSSVDFTGELSSNMNLEIQKTMERNLEVMEENRVLEEQLSAVTQQLAEAKEQMGEMKGKWYKKNSFCNVMRGVRFFSTSQSVLARSYRHVVNRQLKKKVIYQPGDLKPRNLRIPDKRPEYPDYPYGESRIFKRSNRGLFGGQFITFGNKVSEFKNRSRRSWLPNIVSKKLWSEALNKIVATKVTARVLRIITKEGGLDNYLTKDKKARIKELGPFGWRLRHDVLKARQNAEKLKQKNYSVVKDAEGNEIKVFYQGTYNGEPVSLVVGRRKLLQKLYPLVKTNTPGHLAFAAFNNRRKSTPFDQLLAEFETYNADLSDVIVK